MQDGRLGRDGLTNLKHTPNFTNTKQLTASLGTRLQEHQGKVNFSTPRNATSRPSRQSHLLNRPCRDIKHYLTAVSGNHTHEERYLETHVPPYKLASPCTKQQREHDNCNFKACQADPCLLISRRVICIHHVMTVSGQPGTLKKSSLALSTSSNRGSCM